MVIDINEIINQHKKKVKFNSLNIDDIIFYDKGNEIKINKDDLMEFEFTGMSNTQFVTDILAHLDLKTKRDDETWKEFIVRSDEMYNIFENQDVFEIVKIT